jgi:uncharacterized membrane protein
MVQVRRLTATEKTGAIVFYFFILASTLSLCTIAFGWHMPDAKDWALFVLAGILGGIGQILLTQSYRHADTSVIAPFEYTTMIWALLFGWFVFGDLPTVTVLTGDWSELEAHGPFDLLALDGGGGGKSREDPIDPRRWLAPGGTVVLDDFTPRTAWPPLHPDGGPDRPRLHWLEHPDAPCTEVVTGPTSCTLVGTLR